jgi:RNA 2',3'-cyclic 3'-phosphodiesterase
MEQVRCFVAIELPEEVKTGLIRLQAKLKYATFTPVKWVDPAGIHLTLQFLGDVDRDVTGLITEAIARGATGIAPFPLEVTGLGVFPGPSRVRVLWVGLAGELDSLLRLQKAVETNLQGLGFTPEARGFTPHLTLARVRDSASPQERQSLGELVTNTKFQVEFGFKVTSVNLMRSQLTPAGAIYSSISSVPLF